MDLGSGGSGFFYIVFFCARIAQKLRQIILSHFELVTFKFHFWVKLEGPSCSWFSDLVKVTMTPETNVICLWRRQDTLNNPRTLPRHCKTYQFYKYQVSETDLNNHWNISGSNNPDEPSNNFFKTLNMGSIPSRRHGTGILQYGINVFPTSIR